MKSILIIVAILCNSCKTGLLIGNWALVESKIPGSSYEELEVRKRSVAILRDGLFNIELPSSITDNIVSFEGKPFKLKLEAENLIQLDSTGMEVCYYKRINTDDLCSDCNSSVMYRRFNYYINEYNETLDSTLLNWLREEMWDYFSSDLLYLDHREGDRYNIEIENK